MKRTSARSLTIQGKITRSMNRLKDLEAQYYELQGMRSELGDYAPLLNELNSVECLIDGVEREVQALRNTR